jgi:hypothetical protein
LPSVRPVFDHHRLAELLLQRLRDDAADDVGAAAGSERDDHAHRPLRPVLRRGVDRAEEQCGGDGEQAASRQHQRSSLGPRQRALGHAAIVHDVANISVCKFFIQASCRSLFSLNIRNRSGGQSDATWPLSVGGKGDLVARGLLLPDADIGGPSTVAWL